jgi:HNH endonuclease
MKDKHPSQLTDAELVAEVGRIATSERRTTAVLVAHLAEMEARRLHLRAGFNSLFVYCVELLRLSEGGAYNRIEAARLAQRFPAVLDLLAQGSLNLGTLRLLGPHLTPENQDRLFAAASGQSKRDVQRILAAMFPRPDVAASIRKLPTRSEDVSASHEAAVSIPTDQLMIARSDRMPTTEPESGGPEQTVLVPRALPESGGREQAVHVPGLVPDSVSIFRSEPRGPRQPVLLPLSADRYQFRFTGSTATHDKFRRAQDLLRHAVPDGEPGEIFDRALTALLKELERRKFAASDRPRADQGSDSGSEASADAGSRHIPGAVRRAVTTRDRGRCAFVADGGRRCGATALLEFHHVVPHARGGPPTEGNIQLRCRAHNGFEAELDFGRVERAAANSSRDESRGERVRSNSSRGEFV